MIRLSTLRKILASQNLFTPRKMNDLTVTTFGTTYDAHDSVTPLQSSRAMDATAIAEHITAFFLREKAFMDVNDDSMLPQHILAKQSSEILQAIKRHCSRQGVTVTAFSKTLGDMLLPPTPGRCRTVRKLVCVSVHNAFGGSSSKSTVSPPGHQHMKRFRMLILLLVALGFRSRVLSVMGILDRYPTLKHPRAIVCIPPAHFLQNVALLPL
jgi:hypothetical protein